MTRPYAEVIGDPINHSKSPIIHNFWLEKLGIDGEYRACHVRTGELASYFAQRRADPNWFGCNITLPHKQAVGGFLDGIDPAADRIGAINTIAREVSYRSDRLVGYNTDVNGIAEAVAGMSLAGSRVCLIGAGGAARAAMTFIADSGSRDVTVLARNPDKAESLAKEFVREGKGLAFAEGAAAIAGASLLINATQLGMTGQDAMPQFLLDALAGLDREALVFDMVYAPLETAVLQRAGSLGLKRADGLSMLIGQAATAFRHFFGKDAPREYDAELRERIAP